MGQMMENGRWGVMILAAVSLTRARVPSVSPTPSGFYSSPWSPRPSPPEIVGIALSLLNGIGTLGFSLLTPVYGSLVDITGGYGASNGIILAADFLTTIVLILFAEETYGNV